MAHNFDSRHIGVRGVAFQSGFVIYLFGIVLDDLFDCRVDSVPFHEFPDIFSLCAVD